MMFLKDKLTIEDVIKEKQEIIQEDIRLREEIEKMIQNAILQEKYENKNNRVNVYKMINEIGG